jgi:hypothetical protein
MGMDGDNFLHNYFVENEKTQIFIESGGKDVSRLFEIQKRAEDALTIYFLSQYSRYQQSWKHNWDKNSAKSDLSRKFHTYFQYDNFMSSLKEDTSGNSEYLLILHYCSKIDFDVRDKESYESLKALYHKLRKKISFALNYEIMTRFFNFCINAKDEPEIYLNEYLRFYFELVERTLRHENTAIIHSTGFNIRAIINTIKVFITLKKYEELENIWKYSNIFQMTPGRLH